MKIEANNTVYSLQEVQTAVQTVSKSTQESLAPAKQQVDINMHEQNIIATGNESLKAMKEVDFARVDEIKAQIADGTIKFDMGELAKVLANLG